MLYGRFPFSGEPSVRYCAYIQRVTNVTVSVYLAILYAGKAYTLRNVIGNISLPASFLWMGMKVSVADLLFDVICSDVL